MNLRSRLVIETDAKNRSNRTAMTIHDPFQIRFGLSSSSVQLWRHTTRFKSGSDCPPHPYGYDDTRSVSDQVRTVLLICTAMTTHVPFEIRFGLYSSTVRLWRYTFRLRSGSDCPPHPYGYDDTRPVSDQVRTVLIHTAMTTHVPFQIRFGLSTFLRLWRHTTILRSASDCPPQQYGYDDKRKVPEQIRTVFFIHTAETARVSMHLSSI